MQGRYNIISQEAPTEVEGGSVYAAAIASACQPSGEAVTFEAFVRDAFSRDPDIKQIGA